MSSPVFDELSINFKTAVNAAEMRGRLELTLYVLKVLRAQKKPNKAIQDLIHDLETGQWQKSN